uniref:Sarcolemmal membrane-associated protein n=1 Tax=Sinocyclocheilus grahami TaxID=75366 RepID=A0A672SWN8_SINGR
MPSALAVFTCRPNSHPFQERHVYLDEPVKIGRSVARCRPAQNNATFDCKVLSRNHALVWFDHKTGKFYLQDTKSSNGTFINSQRLSRGSEESPPCEVLSGDIIQFGVDVTENTRKVTHGCIVSTIKLFLPDGMEARQRSDVVPAPLPLAIDKVSANTPSMYSQELFQLSQYLQEALHREQMLEQKLATLQRLLHSTQEASESSWQALIDEDRLLSRLEVMGNQLQAYSKNQTEDGIRKELVALTEDKHNYETTAKESLRRVLQEKIEVVRKLSEVERSLSNTEDECTHLREMNERTQEELSELANKYNGAVNEIKDLTEKIKLAEVKHEELTQKGLNEKKELQLKIEEMEEKEQALQARIEALQADNDFTNERLTALQGKTLNHAVFLSVGNHFLLKSGGDCTLIQQYIECQCEYTAFFPTSSSAVLMNHLMNQHQSRQQLFSFYSVSFVNLSLLMSFSLCVSHVVSSYSLTTASALCVFVEMDRNLEAGDTEQVIPHFHRELQEAQELANTGKQKCLELQALLEEERRTNRQQTEESAKQIRFLQSEENTITTTREELYSAQEEILLLRHTMEAATAEREHEIAALQGDLSAVAAELDKWRQRAAKYEVEISNLQASFQLQSQHQERASQLQGTPLVIGMFYNILFHDMNLFHSLVHFLKTPQNVNSTIFDFIFLSLFCSSRERSATLCSSLNALEKSQGDLENKLGSIRDQHQQDASKLKIQLAQGESRTRDLQKEQYEQTEQEKHSINDELEQCKVNLKLLQEKGSNPSILQPVQAIFIGLFLALLYWCFGQLW